MVTITEVDIPDDMLRMMSEGLATYTDCWTGILTSIKATEEDIAKYANVLFECSLKLIEQKPKAVILPQRGGAVLGYDVDRVAAYIAITRSEDFFIYPLDIDASGISRDENVFRKVVDRLKDLHNKSESLDITDEDRRKVCMFPRMDDLTVIDTAYTGMSYTKLLAAVSRALPNAKVNGILVQDENYKSDLSFLRRIHDNMGGDFFYARAPLVFEDQPTMFHQFNGISHTAYIYIPTMGYSTVRDKVLKKVFQKEPLVRHFGSMYNDV
jgi:hypothetical protein